MRETDFSYYITKFFTDFLAKERNVSANTSKSYRDTIKLFIVFFKNEKQIPIEKIRLVHIDRQTVTDFLRWLEENRGNSISTRNQRLAAIHAFFRYLQIEKPDSMLQCQQILSIPIKLPPKPVADYLIPDLLECILTEPNRYSLQGRRDLTLLSILYDTGARVQELCDIKLRDLRLDSPAVVQLTGKGNKSRNVPLMKNSVNLIRTYISDFKLDIHKTPDHPLFFNKQGNKMTRGGISYIVEKYAKSAREKNPAIPEKISPHTFRHTKAMHLYQAGIPLIYIRDILGHTDLTTTQIYAKLDTELKRKALEQVYPELIEPNMPDWNDNTNLMNFLLAL